ncbi:MAG: hypothetical protein HRT73_05330 [Flavobacteriales bacterium]|nr:hypothetical protein [Flavobacteriales bacterium]
MIKAVLFYLFFSLTTFIVKAQDDYVISKPVELNKKDFNTIKNPDFTSYLLSSSSYTLKKKDIRISNTDLLFAKGSYGLTDNTTASLSISLIGTFIASIKQQINLTEGLTMGFSVSIGQLLAVPTDSVIFFTGGQSMVTLGDIQNNITFGVGFYYAKSSFKAINEEKEFFLSNFYVSSQKQISKRVYLIAEGIYFGNYNVLSGALGIKVTIKESMTLGFGIMPLAWIDPNINNSDIDAGALPIITFRMLFRH